MTFDVHDGPSSAAPTVLLSAGLGGAAGYWKPQLAALRRRYRVITYDQAGTGRNRSELPKEHSIGAMAEEQGHHPDLQLAWGKVVVEIWTHKIDGLTESDFVFAAKCDRLIAA